MTKEELAAEIAALRELLTVVGNARLPHPADSAERAEYHAASRDRLATMTIVVAGAMKYAGTRDFTRILRNSSATLSRQHAWPLPYTAEDAETAASVAS